MFLHRKLACRVHAYGAAHGRDPPFVRRSMHFFHVSKMRPKEAQRNDRLRNVTMLLGRVVNVTRAACKISDTLERKVVHKDSRKK